MIPMAIVGLGNIAPRAAQGAVYAENASLYAVVSRSTQKAEAFAQEFHIPVVYSSLEEAVQDEHIALFYLCTPNHLHEQQIRTCLTHGKSVICEKPMVERTQTIKELFALAREHHCFLMEAHKTAFTPLNRTVTKLVQDGAIGRLRVVQASYADRISEHALPAEHWVLQPGFAGCAWDIGVYPICFAGLYANSTIQTVHAAQAVSPTGVNTYINAAIQYANGVLATVSASWLWKLPGAHKGTALLGGDAGYIVIDDYWKGTKATLFADGTEQVIEVSQQSDFTGEIEEACRCVALGLNESPLLGEAASLQIAEVLSAI